MNKLPVCLAILAIGALLTACEPVADESGAAPYGSRYTPLPSAPTILQDATVLTGTGERLDNADVIMRDGKIEAVGAGLDASGLTVVDANGLWVTPGVIGCIQVAELVKYVVGAGALLVNRVLVFDALAMKFSDLKVKRDPDCSHCGKYL